MNHRQLNQLSGLICILTSWVWHDSHRNALTTFYGQTFHFTCQKQIKLHSVYWTLFKFCSHEKLFTFAFYFFRQWHSVSFASWIIVWFLTNCSACHMQTACVFLPNLFKPHSSCTSYWKGARAFAAGYLATHKYNGSIVSLHSLSLSHSLCIKFQNPIYHFFHFQSGPFTLTSMTWSFE